MQRTLHTRSAVDRDVATYWLQLRLPTGYIQCMPIGGILVALSGILLYLILLHTLSMCPMCPNVFMFSAAEMDRYNFNFAMFVFNSSDA